MAEMATFRCAFHDFLACDAWKTAWQRVYWARSDVALRFAAVDLGGRFLECQHLA